MPFIARNPLTIPEVELPSSAPKVGTRGLFARSDGWYDIDSSGKVSKISGNSTNKELENSVKTLELKMNTAEKDINTLEVRMNGFAEMMDETREDVNTLEVRMNGFIEMMGDIEAALDELHNYAQTLIAGGADE